MSEVGVLLHEQGPAPERPHLLLQQGVLLDEVEGVVRQLQRTGVAVVTVPVVDALEVGVGESGQSVGTAQGRSTTGNSPGATHRARPWAGYWVGVAAPLLGLLVVLFVGTLEHPLNLSQLVLTDCRQVHITPVTAREGPQGSGLVPMSHWEQMPDVPLGFQKTGQPDSPRGLYTNRP